MEHIGNMLAKLSGGEAENFIRVTVDIYPRTCKNPEPVIPIQEAPIPALPAPVTEAVVATEIVAAPNVAAPIDETQELDSDTSDGEFIPKRKKISVEIKPLKKRKRKHISPDRPSGPLSKLERTLLEAEFAINPECGSERAKLISTTLNGRSMDTIRSFFRRKNVAVKEREREIIRQHRQQQSQDFGI